MGLTLFESAHFNQEAKQFLVDFPNASDNTTVDFPYIVMRKISEHFDGLPYRFLLFVLLTDREMC